MRARTGSINVTREGRHRVRITMPTGERRTLGVYDTVDEAETQRAAAINVLANEGPADGWSVASWGDRWLTAREIGKAVRDPDSDWGRFNTHIKDDSIARLTLRAVRRRHVREWLKRVRSKVARQTALNTLNVMRGMLAAALEDEILKTNPAAGLKLPKEKRTQEPWTYAVPKEQASILSAADAVVGAESLMVEFAVGSGLRAGEIATLRLADVLVSGPNPHVVVRYGSVPSEPTKGGKIREVPLFGHALRAAKAWLKALPDWAKANPYGLMFPRVRGGFRDERHMLRWSDWKGILTRAGITRRFRFHDLRHTAAASLVSGWWDRQWTLIEVRDFLGHESITTTERYAHLAGTALQKAAAETRKRYQLVSIPKASSAKTPTITSGVPARTRTADPRFRKSSVNVAILHGSDGWDQMAAVSIAFLRAIATGDEVAADAFRGQLGALFVADTTRAIEFAESIAAAVLAASDDERSA